MSNWFDLAAFRGCRIEGRDAIEFCQSQFTADIPSIETGFWQQTVWCSPKGRVRMVIVAARHKDHVEIVVPACQASLLKTLAMFTIGRQVSFGPLEHVSGSTTPDGSDVILKGRSRRALRLDGAKAADTPFAPWLASWHLEDLTLPLPWLNERTQDRFLPQALGMESNQGLSFTKGCYPGQEIVARVHYLGRAPERLIGLVFDPAPTLELAALTEAPLDAGSHGKITVLSALPWRGHWLALAVGSAGIEDGASIPIDQGENACSALVTAPDSLCYHRNQITQESDT